MLLDRALEDNTQVIVAICTCTDSTRRCCFCLFVVVFCLLQAAVQGIVVIYDIGGVTTSHTLMMTPAIMKKHVVVFQVGSSHWELNIILLLTLPCS